MIKLNRDGRIVLSECLLISPAGSPSLGPFLSGASAKRCTNSLFSQDDRSDPLWNRICIPPAQGIHLELRQQSMPHPLPGSLVENAMRTARLATLRFLSLLFLLPGLGGLVISAAISTEYLNTLPRWPVPDESRIIARGIHGIVVYQTPEEDQRLSLIEYSSVACFLLGLGLGVVYLEKWGSLQARIADKNNADLERYQN